MIIDSDRLQYKGGNKMKAELYMVCRLIDRAKYRLIKEEYDEKNDNYEYHALDIKSYQAKIRKENPLRWYPIMDIIKGKEELRLISSKDMDYMIPEWMINILSVEDRDLFYIHLPDIKGEEEGWKRDLIPIFDNFRSHCTSCRLEVYKNDKLFEEDKSHHSVKRILWRYWFFSKDMGYHNIDIKYQFRQKGEGDIKILVDGKEISKL